MPTSITELLKRKFKVSEINLIPISGGSINQCHKVSLPDKRSVFLKSNNADMYPDMFEKEAKGLALIASTKTIKTPTILGTETHRNTSILLLEFIESTNPTTDFFEELGHQLAALHQNTAPEFGLNHSNYMGSLTQENTFSKSYVHFFIHHRLIPQVKLAINRKLLNSTDLNYFELLYNNLENILPKEQPSLVHGDLWSGNYMCGNGLQPVLIDPAIHFGHREADLAMTTLFGGFSNHFYKAYENVFPLVPGFDNRKDIYNLYPLLVHLNLFGKSYLSGVRSIVKHYV